MKPPVICEFATLNVLMGYIRANHYLDSRLRDSVTKLLMHQITTQSVMRKALI